MFPPGLQMYGSESPAVTLGIEFPDIYTFARYRQRVARGVSGWQVKRCSRNVWMLRLPENSILKVCSCAEACPFGI